MSRQTRRILLDDKVDERISAMTSRNQRSDPNRGEKKKLDLAFQSFGKIFKKIYDVFFLSFFPFSFDFLRKIFLEHVYNRILHADYPNVNTVKRNKDQKEKRMGRATGKRKK